MDAPSAHIMELIPPTARAVIATPKGAVPFKSGIVDSTIPSAKFRTQLSATATCGFVSGSTPVTSCLRSSNSFPLIFTFIPP